MTGAIAAAFGRTWEQPDQLSLERLPMSASVARPAAPPRVLGGPWYFHLFPSPVTVPAVAVGDGPAALHGDWTPIEVPGCWARQGYDRPRYTNVVMPFACDPPDVPEANPTGVYRTEFDLARAHGARVFPDGRVVLRAGGAESVAYVWLNGFPVGFGKDTHLASEWDITSLVRPTGNTLAVAVVQWSDASWLEDQDQWWLGGLHRPVEIYETPATYLSGLVVTGGLAEDLATGTLEVQALVGGVPAGDLDGWTVAAELPEISVRTMVDVPVFPHGTAAAAMVAAYAYAGPPAIVKLRVPDARPWSSELPDRYQVEVSLHAPDGSEVDRVATWTGLRRVEIRDRSLRINGAPVYIRGVNRHDNHPVTGRVVTPEDMRADIALMKRHNLNAIRTAHYPNAPELYDIADELGMYVIDEANVETHARLRSLCHDPRYSAAILDRVMRMVARDRNHPCIIGWSLGNESGYGAVHDAAAAWIRRTDPTRFVHYEGAQRFRLEGAGMATDVVCPMYPAIDAIVEWAQTTADPRPLIMCEFSHAMGNSNGSLSDYWAAIEATDGLQGGFIWEWADHGLLEVGAGGDGEEFHAYGGMFGDEPNDGTFCLDGLCSADRAPRPALREVAFLGAPVRFSLLEESSMFAVENRQDFRDLSWLAFDWQLLADGEVVGSDDLVLPGDTPPGGHVLAPVPGWPGPGLADDEPRELSLVVRARAAADQPWCARGHEVAWAQLALDHHDRAPILTDSWSGSAHGRLVLDFLASRPTPCVWRCPTDNDGWRAAGSVPAPPTGPLAGWLERGVDHLDPSALGWVDKVEQHPDGSATVTTSVEVPAHLADLPRLGHVLVLPAGFEDLTWYGDGPHETYRDRRASAIVSRWSSTVADQYVRYARPQEHGNHCETRWFELRRADGSGLRFTALGGGPFEFSARHHFDADLATALTTADLKPRAEVEVHIDHFQRGVGTASCGPDTLPRYLVGPGRYEWSWRIEAIPRDQA